MTCRPLGEASLGMACADGLTLVAVKFSLADCMGFSKFKLPHVHAPQLVGRNQRGAYRGCH